MADNKVAVRLNKFLAERLGISRREADELISSGNVIINGNTAVLGARVGEADKVDILQKDKNKLKNKQKSIDFFNNVCYNEKIGYSQNGKKMPISHDVRYIYLALNKPAGYVCSRKRQGEAETIYKLLPAKYQALKTVGRLDKDSSGLILLTNDGDFAFQMTHPSFVKSKEYVVELDNPLEPLHQQMIADFGIEIGDGLSKLGLEKLDENRKKWQVTMSEGRNRQIRRTFGALGYTVKSLHRVRFGKYVLEGLASGGFEEVEKII